MYDSLMSYTCSFLYFFFFFQAEDGIRDWSVTGVQTCALPIFISPPRWRNEWVRSPGSSSSAASRSRTSLPRPRSEERRVGKGVDVGGGGVIRKKKIEY